MASDKRMLRAALKYAEQGWAIFPVWTTGPGGCACERGRLCEHPGKHPMGSLAPNGFKDATTDQTTITRWWTQHPQANIGVWAGASQLVIIDIDVHPQDAHQETNGFTTWQALLDAHPGLACQTISAVTGGGGRHLFYAAPAGFKPVARLGPGIDVKANGGYVILPPSRHASGSAYAFEPGRTPVHICPAPLPPALRALLTRPDDAARRGSPSPDHLSDARPGNARPGDPRPGDARPGDAYARLCDWSAILEPHGWRKDSIESAGSGVRTFWTRPGKDDGISAVTGGERGDLLYVWSTNAAPFRPETSYTKFGAYALLEHGGDFGAAARRLAEDRDAQPDEAQALGSGAAMSHGAAMGHGAHAPKTSTIREKVKSADLVAFLEAHGYTFRLNLCDETIECNGERLSDLRRAEIRALLRDNELGKHLAAAEDAYFAHAAHTPFHPVRNYLGDLQWDGKPHIRTLADHFTVSDPIFAVYLRKWLIGAVARVESGSQNAVLVLDGPQGVGKSAFARWLCPLPGFFAEGGINPDDKDCCLQALRTWIWEVSELGATTRRTDVEALKSFLSRELFTVRPAYGRYEIAKPALASFVGTVNNASGVFSDPTGSRRFWACTVHHLDWSYTEHIDRDQLWAEATAAFLEQEAYTLSSVEGCHAAELNASYEVEDPVENLLRKHFQLDPAEHDRWTSTADILTTLQINGLQGNTRSNAMQLSATLKRLGFERRRQNNANGYLGVS